MVTAFSSRICILLCVLSGERYIMTVFGVLNFGDQGRVSKHFVRFGLHMYNTTVLEVT